MDWQQIVDYVSGMDWAAWIGILGAISVPMFVISIVMSLWMLRHLSEDYFIQRAKKSDEIRGLSFWLIKLIRNILGLILLAAGIAMLVLPGQGLLTILLAVYFLDFPLKHRIEDKILEKEKVRDTLNRLRHRLGRPSFRFPHDT